MSHHIIIVVPTWVVWLVFVAATGSTITTGAAVFLRWRVFQLTRQIEARKRELQDTRARSI